MPVCTSDDPIAGSVQRAAIIRAVARKKLRILSVIAAREYCVLRENRFHPTELGKLVTELLVTSFGDATSSFERLLLTDHVRTSTFGFQNQQFVRFHV